MSIINPLQYGDKFPTKLIFPHSLVTPGIVSGKSTAPVELGYSNPTGPIELNGSEFLHFLTNIYQAILNYTTIFHGETVKPWNLQRPTEAEARGRRGCPVMIPQAASGIGSQGNQLLVSDVETNHGKQGVSNLSLRWDDAFKKQSIYVYCVLYSEMIYIYINNDELFICTYIYICI